MQLLSMPESKRKPRAKKSSISVNYRLTPNVVYAVKESANVHSRSDNLQSEYLLRIGYLHTRGVNVYALSDAEIFAKFEELAPDTIE